MDACVDVNGVEVKEGDILTFDWFDCEEPIKNVRRMFESVRGWTDKQISDRIHRPIYIATLDERGKLVGVGIEKPKRPHRGRMYLHKHRIRYTKIVPQ